MQAQQIYRHVSRPYHSILRLLDFPTLFSQNISFYFCLESLFPAMPLLLLFICPLVFLFEVTAKPFTPELYIGNIATKFLNNRPLVGRSPQQKDLFSAISDTGDVSVFDNNPELFPSTPEVSGNDIALFDSEDYSLDQESPGLNIHDGNTEGQAAQDPKSLDLFVGSIGESAELPTSCEGGNNLDSFVDNPSILTGRNLIDDVFDLRIPDEILAPKQLCPIPQDTKKPSSQPTENTSRLPFRVPSPDLAGTRCRVENGEGPMYALCCFMEGDENQENACYPGKVVFFFLFFLRLNLPFFFFYDFCIFGLTDQWLSIIRWQHEAAFFGYYICFYSTYFFISIHCSTRNYHCVQGRSSYPPRTSQRLTKKCHGYSQRNLSKNTGKYANENVAAGPFSMMPML